jgi:regulator of protease activity HflC (stomatin/prohibitin superfamily)
MSDNRAAIEQEIRETLTATLASEQLDTSISITQVLVRQITPADSVVASANALVRAKNELLQKEVEVKTAEAEARRIAALNANKGAVEYMEAMALMNISEGIKSGKVNTIVVPVDFKGMVNVTGR